MPLSPDAVKLIRKRVEAINEQLLPLQTERDGLLLFLESQGVATCPVPPAEPEPSQARPPARNLVGKSFRAQAIHHLECVLQEQRPLHLSELIERVEAQGLVVPGYRNKKPTSVLGGVLSGDDRFLSCGLGYWTLADSPDMPQPAPEPETEE